MGNGMIGPNAVLETIHLSSWTVVLRASKESMEVLNVFRTTEQRVLGFAASPTRMQSQISALCDSTIALTCPMIPLSSAIFIFHVRLCKSNRHTEQGIYESSSMGSWSTSEKLEGVCKAALRSLISSGSA